MKDRFELLAGEEVHILIEDELFILQKENHFRFGTDAVLLANWVRVRKADQVIDLGTGSGVIPLLIAYKHQPKKVVGVEILEEMAFLAQRSVILNDLEEKIEIVHHDLRNVRALFSPNTYSLVVSNPPYFPVERGEINLNNAKAVARHEITCNLENLVQAAAYLLGSGGRFCMIHRPERIPEIFDQLRQCKFEPKIMCLIQPKVDRSPNLVMIEAMKDAKPGLKIQPTLVVYNQAGSYTPELLQIYQGIGQKRSN